VPEALQYVPIDLKNLLATGLLPVAFLAIVMHLLLPKIEGDTAG
jgi:xanthine/uracil permease